MIDFFINVAVKTYEVFYEASAYILVGFFLAGLVRMVLRTELLQRILGPDSFASVIKATLFGAPLPICSCGVVPAAVSLRKNGASRPATMSFLISTPETGLPSILLTWGLIGPLMAVIRPLVAMITAITAGIWILLSPGRGARAESLPTDDIGPRSTPPEDEPASCCAPPEPPPTEPSCCCGEGTATAPEPTSPAPPENGGKIRGTFRDAMRYGFVEMMDDLAFWIVFGMVLTGIIGAALPNDFFDRVMGNPTVEMVAMLLVGIPLYLCATSSTPLAAELMAKGLSPGAGLVFLLAGPVTNIGTLLIVGRVFGKRFLRIYLLSIIIVCMTLGMVTNFFFGEEQFDPWGREEGNPSLVGVFVRFIGLLAFIVLAGASFRRTRFRKDIEELWQHLRTFGNWLRGFDAGAFLRLPSFHFTVLLLLLFYFGQGFFTVQPGEAGMVRQFGRLTRSELPPGLHYCLPGPFATSEICRVEEVRQVFGGFQALPEELPPDGGPPSLGESRRRLAVRQFTEESLFITGDENIIQIAYATHYRVSDPERFLYAVEDADRLVARVSGSVLMEILGRKPIDEIYTVARAEVESETAARSQQILDSDTEESYRSGIRIVSFHLLDTHAPLEVHDAFRDVSSAMEDRSTMVNQARGFREERLHLARGEADRTVARARAERVRTVLTAGGEVAGFRHLLDAIPGAEPLTRLRLSLESAERVLPRTQLYITPGDGSVGQFDLWLRAPAGRASVNPEMPSTTPVEEPSP